MNEPATDTPEPYLSINGHATRSPAGRVKTYGMVGNSAPMEALFAALPKIAGTDAPVLIRGESGTGKDLIAGAIHSISARAQGPFAAVNCAALPESLIQSELFGHEKGAFTGAHQRKIGRFEAAHGGTILLDEIGDLPVDMQVNLLRCLETKTIDRVGGKSINVDVRIITATHVDLEQAVTAGEFREDLYYRLNVLTIDSPPLRDRGADVQLLADHFFHEFTDEDSRRRLVGFSPDSRLAISQWHWPGNVRELLNRVKRATVMSDRGPLTRVDLGLEKRSSRRMVMTLDEAKSKAVRNAMLTALDHARGNITQAAALLGVCRMTLYRLMSKHGIELAAERPGLETTTAM